MIRFIKSHGLGNDYLVLCSGETLSAEMVVRVCHRHQGLGADGILEPVSGRDGRQGLRIWNPDGSTAEKSGNGLRIFARWLHDHRGAGNSFEVDVPAGPARCQVHEDGCVTVDMGAPIFDPSKIPTREPLWQRPLDVEGETLSLCAVSVGNPHCVVPVMSGACLDSLPWERWGAFLEVHEFFPARTNVQFLCPIHHDRIEIRIWERGAGSTMASGSSAVAAYSVARKLGWVGCNARVQMPGGDLLVEERVGGFLFQTGPVEEIGVMEMRAGVPK